MRILFVHSDFSIKGGAENYILSLYKKLLSQGINAEIISSFKGIRRISFQDIIYLHKIQDIKFFKYLVENFRCVIYIHDYKFTCPDGKRLLKGRNPCLRNLSWRCYLWGFKDRCMPRSPLKGIKRICEVKIRLNLVKKIRLVLCASDFMSEILKQHKIKNIYVLPYFVRFDNQEINLDEKENRILFVGRLAQGKGVEFLPEIVSNLKNKEVVLDVVGEGPLKEYLFQKIKTYNLQKRIFIWGYKNGEDLVSFYKKAKVLVLPSIWPEVFGIVGIEAGIFGTPAVSFNVGGINTWLKNNINGFLVTPFDIQQMCEKIDTLLEDKKILRDFSYRAFNFVKENFSSSEHIKRFLNLASRL